MRLAVVGVAVLIVSGSAGALPISGELNIAGALRASSTAIDFQNGDEGTGGFVTLQGGTGYFDAIASTNLASPHVGVVMDLTIPAANVSEFMSDFTAPGYSGLTIDLDGIVTPTAAPCTGSEPVNDSCSLGYLTATNLGEGNTALAMLVSGTVEDSAIEDSFNGIVGRYTTQAGRTIEELMTEFAGEGLTASYSANFNAPDVAEPGMLLLLGMGLAAGGWVRRKHSPHA
jgi:hypothetical protein